MKHKKITIFGKVQGIGYRKWLQSFCNKNKISGWVANHKNGYVIAHVLVFDDTQLQELTTHCLIGPNHANITNIDICDSSKIIKDEKFIIKNLKS